MWRKPLRRARSASTGRPRTTRAKEADIAFVVVAVNALATLAMLIYHAALHSAWHDAQTTGVMLGGTIHDVRTGCRQPGYAVSGSVGNTAGDRQAFRVFLLLPMVLGVGWYLRA